MKAEVEHKIESHSFDETVDLGKRCGRNLIGGEVIELISDLGGGKTAFVRGLAQGLDSSDQVMSPTFTISRIYRGKKVDLHHFDFYRLDDPGIMSAELSESVNDTRVAVAVEWSDVARDVLPADRLQVELIASDEDERQIIVRGLGPNSAKLAEALA